MTNRPVRPRQPFLQESRRRLPSRRARPLTPTGSSFFLLKKKTANTPQQDIPTVHLATAAIRRFPLHPVINKLSFLHLPSSPQTPRTHTTTAFSLLSLSQTTAAAVRSSSRFVTPSIAAPGPGLYFEVGKRARDLLYKDFQTDHKFTLTTYAANGAAITAASTKKNEAILSEIQTQLKYNNVKVDVKATSDSQLLITTTTEDLGVPGLKQIVTIPFPYQTAGKAELQYLHDYAGATFGVGLNSKPLINLSGMFGTKAVAVGADVAYDSATGNFTKYNAGVSLTNKDLFGAVMLNNKGDSLTASCYHLVNEEANTAVEAEVTHSISSNENNVIFGLEHSLDPLTTVKMRCNNYGIVNALVQYEFRPKSLFTISTEVDTKAIEKSSKVGLSLVLKP